MNSIKPTIGRKVWYWSGAAAAGVLDPAQAFDATVIHVRGENTVDLRTTRHDGVTENKVGVPLEDFNDHQHGGQEMATWMPFQTGQAKKAAGEGA